MPTTIKTLVLALALYEFAGAPASATAQSSSGYWYCSDGKAVMTLQVQSTNSTFVGTPSFYQGQSENSRLLKLTGKGQLGIDDQLVDLIMKRSIVDPLKQDCPRPTTYNTQSFGAANAGTSSSQIVRDYRGSWIEPVHSKKPSGKYDCNSTTDQEMTFVLWVPSNVGPGQAPPGAPPVAAPPATPTPTPASPGWIEWIQEGIEKEVKELIEDLRGF